LGYRNSKIHFVFTFTYLLLSPNLVSMYKWSDLMGHYPSD
jgi:hypothetical protein